MQADILDDIRDVQRVHGAELIKMTLVWSGRPEAVVAPIEAVAKLVVRFLDIAQRDERNLSERLSAADAEFSGGVELLQAREATMEAPQSRREQFHLAVLLSDGMVLNFALPQDAVASLGEACQTAIRSSHRLPHQSPN